jgi:hypothetical protein
MSRRVSAFYRTRPLAEEAAGRLAAAGLDCTSVSIQEQGAASGKQPGVFDRLAQIIAPEGAEPDSGFLVGIEVEREQIDAAALALETGAERVEISPGQQLAEGVLEFSETAEELTIMKQPVVREEVVMRVEAREIVQEIDETVRRTEVDIERFGPDGSA